jgi:hypothetical protein
MEGEEMEARVPPGKEPGDYFEVTKPVLMVRVPKDAEHGDEVLFVGLDGEDMVAPLPPTFQVGQYFAVAICPTGL